MKKLKKFVVMGFAAIVLLSMFGCASEGEEVSTADAQAANHSIPDMSMVPDCTPDCPNPDVCRDAFVFAENWRQELIAAHRAKEDCPDPEACAELRISAFWKRFEHLKGQSAFNMRARYSAQTLAIRDYQDRECSAPIAGGGNITTSTPESALMGYTLSEIQGRDGVYIKRGDRFFPLEEMEYASRGTSYIITRLDDDFGHLPADSQLVYVGNVRIRVYRVSFLLYAAGTDERHLGGTVELLQSVADNRLSHSGDTWWGLNGVEIDRDEGIPGQLQPHFHSYLDGLGSWIRHTLTGYPNQSFTLSRWEGTTLVEWDVSIDRRMLERIGMVETTYERTLDGYFYLNFPRQSGDLIKILWGDSGIIMEII